MVARSVCESNEDATLTWVQPFTRRAGCSEQNGLMFEEDRVTDLSHRVPCIRFIHNSLPMPIFGALGFGLFLLILHSLLPNVLHQGETTAISVLHAIEAGATTTADLTASIHNSLPIRIPRTPQISP